MRLTKLVINIIGVLTLQRNRGILSLKEERNWRSKVIKKNYLVKFLRNIKICTQILKTKKKDLRNAAS
mgnify:CR=1 FL=1